MPTGIERSLTDDDIVRLGVEAGIRVLSMPDCPSQSDIDQAVLDLGLAAIHLTHAETTVPEGTDA